MAQEIKFSFSIGAVKSGQTLPTFSSSQQIDWSGKDYDEGRISIATTAAGVAWTSKSSLSSLGVTYFHNLDSTNFVELGRFDATTFHPLVRINPGEEWPMRLSNLTTSGTTGLYARADTAAVEIQFRIQEP